MLPADVARCYDWHLCPLAPHCRRTEPVGDELVSMAMFSAESQQRGGCEYYIERREG